MKRFLIVIALLTLVSVPAMAQTQRKESKVDAKAVSTLSDVARRTMQFSLARDAKMFDSMVADDFITTDATGRIFDKKQEMEIISSSNFKLESLEMDNFQVRMFGDTAVVTSRSNVKGSYNGQDISGRYQVTQVFQRKPGVSAAAAISSANSWLMITCLNVRLGDTVSNPAQ
jgi:ketosteroid isomerase-like protein